jgi:hypothetical protein
MQAANIEKKKKELKISAAKSLEPEVNNDQMIKEYIDTYNIENKIFDQENVPISRTTHLALSFKSNVQWIKQITRFGGNQEFERL